MEIILDNYTINLTMEELLSYPPELIMPLIEDLTYFDKYISDDFQYEESQEDIDFNSYSTMSEILKEDIEDNSPESMEIFIYEGEKDKIENLLKKLFGEDFDINGGPPFE